MGQMDCTLQAAEPGSERAKILALSEILIESGNLLQVHFAVKEKMKSEKQMRGNGGC